VPILGDVFPCFAHQAGFLFDPALIGARPFAMQLLGKNLGLFAALAVGILLIVFDASLKKVGRCDVPIEYRIGTIDPRFQMTESELRNDIAEAGNVWDSAANKPLFKYDPDGELTINLVYDWRQQDTQFEQALRGTIDQMRSTAEPIKQQISEMKETFQTSRQDYLSRLAQHNRQVESWNASGGAPADVRASLQDEAAALSQTAQDLKAQNDHINALVAQYNSMVRDINAQTNAINNDGLVGTEFHKGVYIVKDNAKHIDIYQFREQSDLLLVLSHELGHALGLPHNEDPDSIMSPVLRSPGLALSSEDFRDLKGICSQSQWRL
jgi:matrixin